MVDHVAESVRRLGAVFRPQMDLIQRLAACGAGMSVWGQTDLRELPMPIHDLAANDRVKHLRLQNVRFITREQVLREDRDVGELSFR